MDLKKLVNKKSSNKTNNKTGRKSTVRDLAYISDNELKVNSKYLKDIISHISEDYNNVIYFTLTSEEFIINSHVEAKKFSMPVDTHSISEFSIKTEFKVFKKSLDNFKVRKTSDISFSVRSENGRIYIVLSDGNREVQVKAENESTEWVIEMESEKQVDLSPVYVNNMIKLLDFSSEERQESLRGVTLRRNYIYATNGQFLGQIQNPDDVYINDDENIVVRNVYLKFLKKFKLKDSDVESVTLHRYESVKGGQKFLRFTVVLTNGFTLNWIDSDIHTLLQVESIYPKSHTFEYSLVISSIEDTVKFLKKLVDKNEPKVILEIGDDLVIKSDNPDIKFNYILNDDTITQGLSYKIGVNAHYLDAIIQLFKDCDKENVTMKKGNTSESVYHFTSQDEKVQCIMAPMKLNS